MVVFSLLIMRGSRFVKRHFIHFIGFFPNPNFSNIWNINKWLTKSKASKSTPKRKSLTFKMFVPFNISEINRRPSLINLFSKCVVWLGQINEDNNFLILFANTLEISLKPVFRRDIGIWSFILRTKSSSKSKGLLKFHKLLLLWGCLSNFTVSSIEECFLEKVVWYRFWL